MEKSDREDYSLTHTWPVYGHDWAVEHLRRGLRHGRVRHAYLITGPESVGKEALARAFTMALNCTAPDAEGRPCGDCRSCRLISSGNHPDVVYAEHDPNTGALKIEEVRSVCQKLALKPFESTYRIAIFRDFDKARGPAQDALLKTLEEPPPQALLILLAPSVESLLPTIVSRSQVLTLRPVALETVYDVLTQQKGVPADHAELLAGLSSGRMGWALRAVDDPALLEQRETGLTLLEQLIGMTRARRFEVADDLGKDKLALYPLLELWQSYWRDVVLLATGAPVEIANRDRRAGIAQLSRELMVEEAIAALEATRITRDQLVLNLNMRLALEVLFLQYPGLRKT
jgi:DNA polymerase-3 subunit delta'